jgi:hypothetical protein
MIKAYRHTGDAIKALDEYRVGGYLVRFTDESKRDLHDEFFDKSTDFWIERGYPIKGSRTLLEHGLDDFAKVMPIGLIDLMQEDDIGIYVEARLNDRAEYERMLKEMRYRKMIDLSDSEISSKAELAVKAIRAIVETGKTQWSSGALPQSVVVDETNGHIKSWAIIEGSLTFTPAEAIGTEIAPIKSALEQLQDFLSISPALATPRDAQHIEANEERGLIEGGGLKTSNVKSPYQGLKQMTPEMIKGLIALLQSMLGEQGVPEGEAMAMASEIEDEMNAEDAALPEEEKAKALDEELVKAWMGRAIAKSEAKLAKRQMLVGAAKNLANQAVSNFKANAPVSTETAFLPKFTGGNKGGNIVVGEARRYAHLSAEEMALAGKIMQSNLRGGRPNKSVNGQEMIDAGLASEEFIRTMAGKAANVLKRYNGSERDDVLSQQDYSALKSIKADELNASAIEAQGGDWISIFYDNMVWERAREKTELFNLLSQRGMVVKDIPQGAETVEFKIDTASPTVYTRNQARSTDASGRPEVTARITPIGTDKVQATPAEHVLATSNTDILDEDSIINMVNYLNSDIQRTLAESLEDSFINGDTETAASTNVNLIDGTPGTGLTKPLYLAYNGFRKHALVTHSGQANDVNTSLSIDDFFDTIAEYDDNAIESRTDQLVYIVDKDTHRAARRLPELLTPGVAMQGATIYVGQLPDIDGVPIYRSGFLAKSNTAGKISATPGNNLYGSIVSVYPYYWGYGRKRAITIETDRDIMAGVTVFVASVRHVLLARSAKASTISYHITV